LPELQEDTWAQLATTVHGRLLAGLGHSVPSERPDWIVNHCILLYKQHVFGALPMCQESALRTAVRRFFPIDLSNVSDIRAQIAHCFFASNESELVAALRSLTMLTALCAAVIYVVPEQSVSNKHLTGALFLRASRSLLKIYEDYDLEHTDSSSMGIRLFHSSAIQSSTGSQQLAFHVLNQAGLIAMRMRLYDETSLEGLEPLEENLRRNAFWQLYVCDKTAMVMKGRPVTIHEALFDTELSLSTKSQNPISLFNHGENSNGTVIEARLLDGFHLVRRLWAMAARLIHQMELSTRNDNMRAADSIYACEDRKSLSEAYFEMITLANDSSPWARFPTEGSIDASEGAEEHTFDILYRQRTSFLITVHSIKIFVMRCAILSGMPEVLGLSAEPQSLAMRQVELAQSLLSFLESVPFIHLRTEGEHCVSKLASRRRQVYDIRVHADVCSHVQVEKIRRVGSLLLEVAHGTDHEIIKSQATQCAMRLVDVLARLDSKTSDLIWTQ
jgi:hypothetical protein